MQNVSYFCDGDGDGDGIKITKYVCIPICFTVIKTAVLLFTLQMFGLSIEVPYLAEQEDIRVCYCEHFVFLLNQIKYHLVYMSVLHETI